MQVGQKEPASERVDSSLINMRTGMMGSMTGLASHQVAFLNQQNGLMEPMTFIPVSQSLTVSNKQMDQMEPLQPKPNQRIGDMEAMLNNLGSQKVSLPSKRKAAVEQLNTLPQQLPTQNKRMAHEPLVNLPIFSQLSSPNKRIARMQSVSGTPQSQNSHVQNKKMARNDSISSKSGCQREQVSKNRNAQGEPSPTVQTVSFGAVRSKMRESLAAALAMVSQHQGKAPKEGTDSPREVVTPRQTQIDSQSATSIFSHIDKAERPENPSDTMAFKQTSPDKLNDKQSPSGEDVIMGNSEETLMNNGQGSLSSVFLPDGDACFTDNFFVKDELLQGNGLSWAWDIDIDVPERREVHTDIEVAENKEVPIATEVAETKKVVAAKSPELHVDVDGDGTKQVLRSPQDLALKIEFELFKLFGGVNKKYKEKGRSLMFNLKDRSNPELRERVMSGEISPERLCAMSAEELASKELSQWRMAKAEELAQMIVLPDSNVRRLVKKTHKGEYQVEVEQNDDVSVEVSVGATIFTQLQPKEKNKNKDKGKEKEKAKEANASNEADGIKDSENAEGEKSNTENQDRSCSLTIPADGTDFMQGLIVDEHKDEEFLPPIVSLDEFMESLNSEPPFENLPADSIEGKPLLVKEKSDAGDELENSDPMSEDPVYRTPGKDDKLEGEKTDLETKPKPSESHMVQKFTPPSSASKAQYVWEGILQLNVSASITVTGLFRSGDKTSTEEWPSPLDIKGRVRLDAFEKFLQELPMSRSRAVMVLHFALSGDNSEIEHASLSEVVDSYVVDERLGFAEPSPGVELYFCPPHPKMVEMLSKHLSKDPTEILNSTDNGLIGVVVWRKVHLTSTISHISSSHHKHSSKRQNLSSRRPQEKEANVNVKLTPKTPMPYGQPPQGFPSDDDGDIPPGFGSGATRDDDDLPEFNFSGNVHTHKSSSRNPLPASRKKMTNFHPSQSRPVDQVRELIQKYGQPGNAKKWNDDDDDDDDIPEWQPQAPHQQIPLQSHPSVHGFPQPIQPHMVSLGSRIQVGPSPVVQHPMSIMQNPAAAHWQQGAAGWVQPSVHPNSLGGQLSGAQQFGLPAVLPGTQWRRDAPRRF